MRIYLYIDNKGIPTSIIMDSSILKQTKIKGSRKWLVELIEWIE